MKQIMRFSIEFQIAEPAGGEERIHQIIRDGVMCTQEQHEYYKLDGSYVILPKLASPILFKITHLDRFWMEDTNAT